MRLTRILGVVGVLLALAVPAAGQGALAPIGISQFNADGSGPCNGCVITSFTSGTTTPLATYADAALGSSNGTSVTLDAAGRAAIYLDSRLSYKLVLRTAGGTEIWTRDGIVGQLSGVITAQAANTRGIQVSRAGADAGISIASTGGSGKTYGLVSNTSGGFRIQDDSDSTPRLEWLNNNITATLTGTFSVPTGLFSLGGFGTHLINGGGTGANLLSVRNTSAGSVNIGGVHIGNDAASNALALQSFSSTYSSSALYLADGASVESTRIGGLSVAATHASGALRFYSGGPTPRMNVSSTGIVSIGDYVGSKNLNVRSTSDDLTGGIAIDRFDNSYLVLNVNDSSVGAVIQAGDSGAYLPTTISAYGGGVSVGGGAAFLKVVTATAAWNPASTVDGAMANTSLSITGATSGSPCFVGFRTFVGGFDAGPGVFFDARVNVDPSFVTVQMFNKTGGTIDLDNNTVRVTCFVY